MCGRGLTRAVLGNVFTPPPGFWRISKKRRGIPVHSPFPHMLWKLQTQVTQCQVTRSRQVTSSQKSLNVRHSYTECPITLKLLAIDIRTSIYKMFISELWYPLPKVRSILRPLISQWGKWKAPLLEENHSKHSQTQGRRHRFWIAGDTDPDSKTIVNLTTKNRCLNLALVGGPMRPPWVLLQCTLNYESDRAEICLPYGASFAQLLVEKFWSGHVRPRSYDITRGTRSGHFCEK